MAVIPRRPGLRTFGRAASAMPFCRAIVANGCLHARRHVLGGVGALGAPFDDLLYRVRIDEQRSFRAKDEIVWQLAELRIGTPGRFDTVVLD
jgi:hypothetical protein